MRRMEKKPLIVLTGPTAVGKTSLSIRLAKAVGGEIISADSMQVYRGMDIGSAKITPSQMQGVPHHLVDVLDPEEDFNVFLFQKLAFEAMEKIYAAGHVPILVGGTGFYIQAVTKEVDFTKEAADGEYRRSLEELARQQGAEALHEMLARVDPKSAEAIHAHNVKRVIRALEYYEQNHSPISEHNQAERAKSSPYQLAYFVLNAPRPLLYQRIDARVDEMMEQGLLHEVESLYERGCRRGMSSMQGLGYKEILDYLTGDIETLVEAVDTIKRDTRHFAKRQLTWFRREGDVIWVDKDRFDYDEDRILDFMLECIRAESQE